MSARPDIEEICQGFGVVAMACQARLQVIEITRQYTLDEVRGDGFLPHLIAFLQRTGKVILNLERGESTGPREVSARSP